MTQFDLIVNLPNKKKQIIKNIKIPLIGIHNIRNSVAAAAVALTVGITINDIKDGLLRFNGVQRRFNKIFSLNGVDFYDDYAHHPTEIQMTLDGVKKVYKDYEKVCVFQPHRISRLRDLRKEFSFSFQNADIVILCPVYLAGEKIKLGFSYLKFAKEIIKNSKVRLFYSKDNFQLAKFIKKNIYGKKNCNWYGCRYYFKLDERTSRVDEMKINQLKRLLNDFDENLHFEYDLKKKIGLI